MFRKIRLIGIVFLFCSSAFQLKAQEDLPTDSLKEKKYSITGYVKYMSTFNIGNSNINVDHLIHNRLNMKWFPHENLTFYMDLRNRAFFGNTVSQIPQYGMLVDQNNDYVDMSVIWPNTDHFVGHAMIDRAYLEYIKGDWEFRLGRQRINWGINTVWNPNDLFNAYNFFDFDYEERQGADAIRITKYFGYASSLELAAKMADHYNQAVVALKYAFNKFNYDFQIIGGTAKEDISLGMGWAGNIGTVGFKGEVTHFFPYDDLPTSYTATSASVGFDYSFSNSLYVLAGYLWNSEGDLRFQTNQNLLAANEPLSAKNLLPTQHGSLIQASYPVHPLVNVGMAVINFPGDNALLLNPTVSISIKDNFDFGVFGQLFFDENINGDYSALANLVFLRLKYSF